jgi:hypothetical protein
MSILIFFDEYGFLQKFNVEYNYADIIVFVFVTTLLLQKCRYKTAAPSGAG